MPVVCVNKQNDRRKQEKSMTEANESADKKTIVIVEDDTDLLRMLTFSFKAEGYTVSGFAKGKDAEEFLNNEQNQKSICLIILDRLLPDMDGIEILKEFTKKFNKSIPVMVLSALSSERDMLTGLKEGAVEYITKPFDLSILSERAQILMSRFN